jgi:hypothetical protein
VPSVLGLPGGQAALRPQRFVVRRTEGDRPLDA